MAQLWLGHFFFHFGLGSKSQETPVPWFKLHYQGWSKMSDLFTYNKCPQMASIPGKGGHMTKYT